MNGAAHHTKDPIVHVFLSNIGKVHASTHTVLRRVCAQQALLIFCLSERPKHK